jgi:nitrate/TMAO reductase-like tetraheme cytochrome c subunit
MIFSRQTLGLRVGVCSGIVGVVLVLCAQSLFVAKLRSQSEGAVSADAAPVEPIPADAAPVVDAEPAEVAPADAAPIEAAPTDDDFGAEPAKDDDFGEPEAKDDDFGADPAADDDFGDDPKKDGDAAKDDLFGDDDPAGEGLEEKTEPEVPVVYRTAAEAHLTFLKALETEKRFPSAATCADCHPDHYREWSVSAHAYAQMSPMFNTMHAAVVELTSGTNGDFCIRCHTQIGMQREEPLFTSNLKRHPASVEGITCVVCHRVEMNYGKISGRMHINQGDIFTTVFGPRGDKILKETLQAEEVKNKLNIKREDENGKLPKGKKHVHATITKFDPISKSGFCGACHDVNLLNGFRLEEAFSQYKNSPANKKGQSCQDCHMGKIPGAVATTIDKRVDREGFDKENYATGPGARIGGDIWAVEGDDATGNYGFATTPRKRTNHMFAGPDYSIIHPAIFPHSRALREAFWEYQRVDEKTGKTGRVGLEELIAFKWEEGWGDPESSFEKRVIDKPELEKGLSWPWDDSIARLTLREKLNDQFKLLNILHTERTQVLRRALQLHDFELTRNDKRGIEFRLKVVNGTDGHGVPTGFDAERLMYLEVMVKDRQGRVVFHSGERDPNGDVLDLHSSYVHAHAKRLGSARKPSAWKAAAGLELMKSDQYWLEDRYLFSLQSKFLTRNLRGGEREQVLAVNQSIDPLPYIRPDTRPGILVARPGGARKQSKGLPPDGERWAKYKIKPEQLSGADPYKVEFRFICQMVPVNLVKAIAGPGFDYNLSPREVAKRVVHGHRVSPSESDSSRRGGALTIWDKAITLPAKGLHTSSFKPSEKDIMAPPAGPFPWRDPATFGGIDTGGIEFDASDLPPVPLPEDAGPLEPNPLLEPSESEGDDSFD